MSDSTAIRIAGHDSKRRAAARRAGVGTDRASAAPCPRRPGNGRPAPTLGRPRATMRGSGRRRRPDDPRGRCISVSSSSPAGSRFHMATWPPARQRQASSTTLRDRADGTRHEIPAFAVVWLVGEVLGTFRAMRRSPARVRRAREGRTDRIRRHCEETRLLPDRVDQPDALHGHRRSERQSRESAAAAQVSTLAGRPRPAAEHSYQAIEDVAARDLFRAAQSPVRLIVCIPGNQETDVRVDGRQRCRIERQLQCRQSVVDRRARTSIGECRRGSSAADSVTGQRNAAGAGTDQGFVHARTTLSRCAVPAPRGVTFPAPPAFQFSPAVRFSDRISPIAEAGEVTVLGLGRRPRWARQWCKAGSVAIALTDGSTGFSTTSLDPRGLWRNGTYRSRPACG